MSPFLINEWKKNDGSSLVLQYVNGIKTAADILQLLYIIGKEKSKSGETKEFLDLIKQFWMHRLRRAGEHIYLNRQEKSRRPKNLLSHSDIDNFELYE